MLRHRGAGKRGILHGPPLLSKGGGQEDELRALGYPEEKLREIDRDANPSFFNAKCFFIPSEMEKPPSDFVDSFFDYCIGQATRWTSHNGNSK